MKKKLTSAVLALVAAFGISTVAQAPAQKCQKGDSCRMEIFFEGITLTPDQQTKIAALKDNCRKQSREQMQQKKQERDNRAKCRKDAQRARLAEMKNILTPEQYVVYLENIVVNAPSREGMHRGHHGNMKMANGGRSAKHAKMNRTDKAAKSPNADKK